MLIFLNTAYSQQESQQSAIANTVNQTTSQTTPTLIEENTDTSMVLTLLSEGDKLYKNKSYFTAIEQYQEALLHLSGTDNSTQQKLAETYKKIAQSYKRLDNRKKAASFYKKALKIFTSLKDRKNIARTYISLAEAHRYLENYSLALDYSVKGLKIQNQIDDPIGQAKAHSAVGIIYRQIDKYEKSLEYIYKAYLYYKEANDINGVAKSSNQMGLLYTRLKQFDEARSFYQSTLDLPEDKVEPKELAAALRETAVIELNAKKYNAAMVKAKKAYQIYNNEKDKSKQSITARIIAHIYREQQNNSQAIAYYRESFSFAFDIDNKLYQLKALRPLGVMVMEVDPEEGLNLLKRALKLSIELNNIYQRLYANRELRKAEKSQGNIAEALTYAEKEIFLSDLIQRERDEKGLILAKVSLDSHKVDMELKALRKKTKLDQLELYKKNNEIDLAEQENLIAELELTKNRYANLALGFLLAICLIVVLFIYRRFIHSRKQNQKLDYLATHDSLTNCYNRRVLFEVMNKDFSELTTITNYSIIMVDIDHFKKVNDAHGHLTGDKVICSIANILQSSVRKSDIVARFGGEEFCIILSGTSKEEAMGIAESMCGKVKASRFDDVAVTCSFGVASIQASTKTATDLIHQADIALYKSKSNGRNQVTLWDQSFEED